MDVLGQIIGFIFAAFLLRLAYKFFRKEKYPTCTMLATVGSLILLCSFPWFQGWAKAYFDSILRSKLEALGEQVNSVQESTTEMHRQLANHQTRIEQHQAKLAQIQQKIREAESNVFVQQSEISNQYGQISMVQANLDSAQTNILFQQNALQEQQKKLGDIEYMVQNLFEETTNEAFSASDTNHVWFKSQTNGGVFFLVRLSNMPIAGSVHTYAAAGGGPMQLIGRTTGLTMDKNLCFYELFGFPTNTTTFTFEYVIDARKHQFFRRMPTSDSIIMNGRRTAILAPHRFY